MENSRVLKLKTNFSVRHYSESGVAVRTVLCSACMMVKRHDLIGTYSSLSAKPCARCGQKSESMRID